MNRREIIFGAAALAGCSQNAESQAPPTPFPMRRGVNLGNALEAPNEGDWGYRIEQDHLAAIADASFDGVRLPVRWDATQSADPPYRIKPQLLTRVREVVDWALERSLMVQLNAHHHPLAANNETREHPRFNALWRQVAEAFADAPESVFFEPLNEPNGDSWRGDRLATFQAEVASTIRESNPDRLLVFGPGNWNSLDAFQRWSPPANAGNIAASIHYYEPYNFTHQNAEWLESPPSFERAWGTTDDINMIIRHARAAAERGAALGLPVQLGEFGVNRAVPIDQRALWTQWTTDAFGLEIGAWCIWDFAGAFPIWDRERRAFIPEILRVLEIGANAPRQ